MLRCASTAAARDLLRVVLERRDPGADVGGAVERLVPDAELLAGHHGCDLRAQFFPGVGLRAEPPMVDQRRPVQPARVPGRMSQFVERRVRVGIL